MKKMIKWIVEKNCDKTKDSISEKNAFEIGKKLEFNMQQLDLSNALEMLRGVLYTYRSTQSEPEEIKKITDKINEVVNYYYLNQNLFPKSIEFITIVEEFEKIINCKNQNIEFVVLNIHLYDFDEIVEKEKEIILYIENEENEEKRIIFVEKLINFIASEENNDKKSEFLEKIYTACEKKDGWRLFGVFAFFLNNLPESIKHKLTTYENNDIKKFIESKDKNFYHKYSLNLKTLLFISKGVALEKKTEAIDLEHIDTAMRQLYIDKDFKNEKIVALIKVISKVDNTGNGDGAKKYLDNALETEGKISFSKEVKVFKQLFEEYIAGENPKIFAYEKNIVIDTQLDKTYYEVLKEFAEKLYKEKLYKSALIYFERYKEDDKKEDDKKEDDTAYKTLVCSAKSDKLEKTYESLYTEKKDFILSKCDDIMKLVQGDDSEQFKKYFVLPCEKKKIEPFIDGGKYQLILLLAKYVAIEKEAETIKKEHIKEVTKYLCMEEKGLAVLSDHDIEILPQKEKTDIEKIVEASIADKKEYEGEVKQLVQAFKEDKDEKYFTLFDGNCSDTDSSIQDKDSSEENQKEEDVEPKEISENMEMSGKDVLLLAKAFAIKAKSDTIKVEHLERALGSIEISDSSTSELIPKNLDIETGIDIKKAIEEAENEETMYPDEELKNNEIFGYLKNNKETIIGKSREH